MSFLDVFIGSIINQESDNCDDCVIEMVIKAMLAGKGIHFTPISFIVLLGESRFVERRKM